MGHGTGHDILAVVIMTVLVALPTMLWKRGTKTKLAK
jgi:metal-dependent amidase/aminoacylase/carboxypeptidase family protein